MTDSNIKMQVEIMDKKRLETHGLLLKFASHIFHKHSQLFFDTEFPYEDKVAILKALNISPTAFSNQLIR